MRTVLFFFLALPAFAQVERASLSGIVTDPSRAALAGAKVAAHSLTTGVDTATVTNSTGNYYLTLQPDTYSVEISQPGFASIAFPASP